MTAKLSVPVGIFVCAILSLAAPADARLKTFGRVAVFEQGLLQAEQVTEAQPHESKELTGGPGEQTPQQASEAEASVTQEASPKQWPRVYPADVIRGHEGDLDKVLELHSLMQPLALNGTVVVVPANLGFLDQALSLRCRLLSFGSTNILIWALDKETSQKLQDRGIVHYYDSTLFSVSGAVGYGVDNAVKGRMMSERPRVWWRILATGYNMLFVDADVVVFDRPEKLLEGSPEASGSTDLEGQLDYQAKYGWKFEGMSSGATICAGVFWIRSSPKALHFMDLVIKSFEDTSEAKMVIFRERNRWDDQLALNFIAHDPWVSAILNPSMHGERRSNVSDDVMRVLFSNPERVLGGTMLDKTKVVGIGKDALFSRAVGDGQPEKTFRPVTLHLNGFGMKAKVDFMKDKGWWQLDDALNCI